MAISNIRLIAKTISYRIVATGTTTIAIYTMTGQIKIALAAGILDILGKSVLYYIHELAWLYAPTIIKKHKELRRIRDDFSKRHPDIVDHW